MPASTFTTVDDLSEQIGKAVHNWGSHTVKVALTNSAPSASNTILADITQISASGGYTAGAGGDQWPVGHAHLCAGCDGLHADG